MMTKFAQTTLPTLLLGALIGVSPSQALVEIARGTLGVSAGLRAEYDSNIFANATEVDDVSVIFSPGVNWTRNAGVVSATLRASVRAISFTDNSSQDGLDPSFSANINVDRAEKGRASFNLDYARSTEANDILLDRTKSDQFNGGARVDYYYSEKTGVRLNGSFRVADYRTTGFNDIDGYSLGAGLLYRYSPKLTADLSYGFSPERATNLIGLSNPSSDNHRFTLGLEGELRPKLNGLLSLGLVRRAFDLGGSTSTMLVASSLSWTATGKTNLVLSASNNFDTTAAAQSARSLQINLSVRQALTEKISLSGSVGHQSTKLAEVGTLIGPRSDEAILLAGNLAYRINDHYSAQAGLTHRVNDSTLALAEYDRTVFSLGVNASF